MDKFVGIAFMVFWGISLAAVINFFGHDSVIGIASAFLVSAGFLAIMFKMSSEETARKKAEEKIREMQEYEADREEQMRLTEKHKTNPNQQQET